MNRTYGKWQALHLTAIAKRLRTCGYVRGVVEPHSAFTRK